MLRNEYMLLIFMSVVHPHHLLRTTRPSPLCCGKAPKQTIGHTTTVHHQLKVLPVELKLEINFSISRDDSHLSSCHALQPAGHLQQNGPKTTGRIKVRLPSQFTCCVNCECAKIRHSSVILSAAQQRRRSVLS